MIDIFEQKNIDLSKITCHSGGAEGSDTYWETIGEEFGVRTRAYSYKTKYHTSTNKIEISEDDYTEGISKIKKANSNLNRYGIDKFMNLLARNWAQVKYSSQVFAIGRIINPGQKSGKGYYCKSKYQTVDGGSGYAVQMAIDSLKDVYVYDQVQSKWFKWSHNSISFIEMKSTPKIIVENFAGIGTREILPNGIQAIRDVYETTFDKKVI